DADHQCRDKHIAGTADDARQAVEQPEQHAAGEHHVRIGHGRVEFAARAAERTIDRPAEAEHDAAEHSAEHDMDDDGVHRQRIGLGALAIADETPPPMAPAEIICISMTRGKTSAMPASASVPSFDTNQVSINPVAACATITNTLGHPIRNKVATMGPRSNARVRGLSSAGATTGASRAPDSPGAAGAASLVASAPLLRGSGE